MIAPANRKYLIEQAVAGFVINFVLNGLIAWALFRSMESVPLWGEQSIMVDTMATACLLPFLSALIITSLTRKQIADGKLAADHGGRFLFRWLPWNNFLRSIVFGIVPIPFAAVVVWGILTAVGVEAMAVYPFIGMKAFIAGMISVFVAPPIALAALDMRGRV